jgi:hypothetical protein
MSPGKPCEHCTAKGCGIYETRPENPCRSFECGWLQDGSPLPEHLRPDRSGVIVILGRKWRGREIIRALPAGERIPREPMEWLKAFARERQMPLLFLENIFEDGRFKARKQTGYGPPDFVQAVRNAIGLQDIEFI